MIYCNRRRLVNNRLIKQDKEFSSLFSERLIAAVIAINKCIRKVIFLLLISIVLSAFSVNDSVWAEGSRDLYPSTYAGFRANLDFQPTQTYVNKVKRNGFLYVYAQQGEYILLGSRNRGSGGNIYVYTPQDFGTPGNEKYDYTAIGSPAFTCSAVTSGLNGIIVSRAAELAGPKSADGLTGGTDAYAPCAYQAPQTGIYGVVFGPATSGSGPNGVINPPAISNNSVSAWDVTIRTDATSTTDINGRLYTYAFVGFTGGNQRPVFTDHYYITSDGYRYKQSVNGLDPNGYTLYANSLGFLDNEQPLYKDIRGKDALVTSLPVGVTSQIPQYPIFFSDISPEGQNETEVERVLVALSIPLSPPSPTVTNIGFTGNVSGSTSTIGVGGSFTFDTTDTITYQIIISCSGGSCGAGDFDPENTNNRTLTGIARTGSHTVMWDGKNNNNSNFPAGGPYQFRVSGRAGETHFPIIDAENNFYGGPVIKRLNGISAPDSTVYYDDRGYITRSGNLVGILNGTLCPSVTPSQPTPPFDLLGTDSTIPYRQWGVNAGTNNTNADCTSSNAWGDAKGVDLWTYYSHTPPIQNLTIVPVIIDVATSISGPNTATVGSTVQGAFSFINNGTGTANGVTYSMNLSPGLGSVTFGNLPPGTNASYNSNTGEVSFGGTQAQSFRASTRNPERRIVKLSARFTPMAQRLLDSGICRNDVKWYSGF